MTLEKRVKALEGQVQQGSDNEQIAQGVALLRTKLDALRATTPPAPPLTEAEKAEFDADWQAYVASIRSSR